MGSEHGLSVTMSIVTPEREGGSSIILADELPLGAL